MSRLKPAGSALPHVLVFVILLAIYLRTTAPGLTWANGGADGGDLIAAAASGGVAHPTGYPLYLLLARLFQFLPVGSLAFRTNMMSALATALAGAGISAIVRDSLSTQGRHGLAGPAAGLAFGLSPLAWSQAVITEVYGLQALLVVLVLYVYRLPLPASPSQRTRLDSGRGLLLGLAVSNHVTGSLLIPAALLLGSQREQAGPGAFSLDRGALRRQLLGLGVGLSPYLVLPLRALADPPINWGNVTTLPRFWWLVSGRLYRDDYLRSTLPDLLERVQAFASLWVQQFGLAGLALGLAGLVLFGARRRLAPMTLWTAGTSLVFALVYGSADSYVYLIPVVICFAIWWGWGLGAGMDRLPGRLRTAGILLVFFYLSARSLPLFEQVDASRDLEAEAFGRAVLAAAPQQAILFAQGDRAVFSLWYFHFALEQRPDLAVVAVDLLHFDWYQESLRSAYPGLRLTGPLPWPETIARENPSRAVCYAAYRGGPQIDCPEAVTAP